MTNQYRKDYHEAEGNYYWTLPRVFFAIIIGLFVLGTAGGVGSLLLQPGRIINKTLDADNVINNYEWFHDANGTYLARVAQVKQFKSLLADESDAGEKSRLRIDMAAIQQSCRELARRYNANAEKMNRGIFRERSLPDNLKSGDCE